MDPVRLGAQGPSPLYETTAQIPVSPQDTLVAYWGPWPFNS